MPPKKPQSGEKSKASQQTTRQTRSTTAATRADRKRKAEINTPEDDETRPPRRAKTHEKGDKARAVAAENRNSEGQTIVINRAPVLELWGACVAQVLHPRLPWSACLSIGSSIATLTAIAKGRSIGTISQPDADTKENQKKKKGASDEGGTSLTVMGFPMTMRDDAVVVKGTPKAGSESSLTRRFGVENFHRVRSTMEKALQSWKDNGDELDKRAFHMYEQFRPDVAKGQRGWGRKGELRLDTIEEFVSRESGD